MPEDVADGKLSKYEETDEDANMTHSLSQQTRQWNRKRNIINDEI